MAKRTLMADRLNEALNPRFDVYQQVIGEIHRAVDQFIPVGTSVLVVSKGDPALLALGQRTAWHFPRAADGEYAGFHPADSNDAISRLDVQRQLGARYLVIPSTSAWWHSHYADFIAHVRSNGRTLFDDPAVGTIFELAAKQVSMPVVVGQHDEGIRPAHQLMNLVEAILPTTATIALLASRAEELVPHSPLPAIALSYLDDGVFDEEVAISRLRELAGGIADFLVVPVSSNEWLLEQPSFAKHIDDTYSLVTDQRNLCRIYDLGPQGGVSR